MKKIFSRVLFGTLLLGLALPVGALAADQDLEKRLDALQKEMDSLKQQVDKTEKKSLGRWLEISGDYRFRYDYLHGQGAAFADGQTFFNNLLNPASPTFNNPGLSYGAAIQQATNVKNDALYTNRFGLNLKAKATKDVSVTARFLMYKVAGGQDDAALRDGNTAFSFDRAGLFDGTIGHVPSDNKLAVDRVYATWNNIGGQPLWFSIGRRPSTGGVPSHLRQDNEPQGNSGVPALLVDYAFDGVTIGYAPDIDFLPGAYGKFCYGRGFQNGITDVNTGNGLHNTDMIGINLVPYDTDPLRAEFQYNRGLNIFDAPQMLTGPFVGLQPRTNVGDIDWFGLDFLGKIKKVGFGDLNWFVDGGLSMTHNSGNTLHFAGQDTGMGLLFTGKPQNETGWAVYVGGRYDLPETGTKLGLEYNHGSKNWITFTPAADDMWTSKLGTRGNVFEGYVIQELKLQPISSYLSKVFFRVGYQYYDFEFTGSNNWLGAPIDVHNVVASGVPQLVAPLKSAQDLYATFEVHF